MKVFLSHFLLTLAVISAASGAFSLKPGDRFPDLGFPSITGGEEKTISTLTDKKLMLHLYASW